MARARHRDRNGNTGPGRGDERRRRCDPAGRTRLAADAKASSAARRLDAIDAGKESTVALFIQYKVDLNAKTQSGFTPLSLAPPEPPANRRLQKNGAR
jgi:hypothetical protein